MKLTPEEYERYVEYRRQGFDSISAREYAKTKPVKHNERCGCGALATHSHRGMTCCGGMMCCPTANI